MHLTQWAIPPVLLFLSSVHWVALVQCTTCCAPTHGHSGHFCFGVVVLWTSVCWLACGYMTLLLLGTYLDAGLLNCTVPVFNLVLRAAGLFQQHTHESQFLHTLANKHFILASSSGKFFVLWISSLHLLNVNLIWKNVYPLPVVLIGLSLLLLRL